MLQMFARRIVGCWNVIVALFDAVADGAFAAELSEIAGVSALDTPVHPGLRSAHAAHVAAQDRPSHATQGFGEPSPEILPLPLSHLSRALVAQPLDPLGLLYPLARWYGAAPPPSAPDQAPEPGPKSAHPSRLVVYYCPMENGVDGVLFARADGLDGIDAPVERMVWVRRVYASPLEGASLN
jgi:hypothetical protein